MRGDQHLKKDIELLWLVYCLLHTVTYRIYCMLSKTVVQFDIFVEIRFCDINTFTVTFDQSNAIELPQTFKLAV